MGQRLRLFVVRIVIRLRHPEVFPVVVVEQLPSSPQVVDKELTREEYGRFRVSSGS